MKKKVGIITISDYNNYGNRLQNYAVQEVIKKLGLYPDSIQNIDGIYKKNYIKVFKYNLLNFIKYIYPKRKYKRNRNFLKFNKNIKKSKFLIDKSHIDNKINDYYDYFVVGSDQVWNPNFDRLSNLDLLEFATDNKKISFSASFGVSNLLDCYNNKIRKSIGKFKALSVREDAGKKIVEDITGRKDVQVLVDPTMLLTAEEWDKVSKKPDKLKSEKYILNYFLGELSEARKKEINRIAKENDCEVINLLDKNDPFYCTGPAEFLYLEKNAFLICTDSFHSSVFAILYNRPFIVFNREENIASMNSRIETLINKFNLKNREYNEKEITKENLEHDYTEAYQILKKEKEKSIEFLKKAFGIEIERN